MENLILNTRLDTGHRTGCWAILAGLGECWTKTLDAGQHKLKLRHSVYCHPYILMPHEKRQNKGKDIQNLQPSEEAADFEQATMLFDLYFPSFFLY